jgi:transcriptional regulator with XRE-family HTH domain
MADDLEKRVGALIAAAREQTGMSQAELAHRVSMHETSVSNIERGVKLPNLRTLLELSEALGRPIQELVPMKRGGRGASDKRIRLEARIAEALRQLTDDRLDFVYELLVMLVRVK